MGVFVVVVAIGAGVAYYFAPAAINNIVGINSAQVDGVVNVDLSATDDASSSLMLASDTSVSDVVPVITKTKKIAQKKESITKSVTTTTQVDPSQGQSVNLNVAPTLDSVITVTSSSPSQILPPSIPAPAPCSFPGVASSTITTQKIIFNEIAWMGSPSASTAEWIEIKNISASAIDLSGWELLNTSGKIKIPFSVGDTIAPGGLLLLSRGSGGSVAGGTVSGAKIYSGDLANTGDILVLMDSHCSVSDYLDASHGWSAGNNTTKQTLERDTIGSGWHTSALPGGTPGLENSMGASTAQYAGNAITSDSAGSSCGVSCSNTSSSATDAVLSDNTDILSLPLNVVTPSVTSSPASDDVSGSTSATTTVATVDAPIATTTAVGINHVLIAVVQITGASSSNDLVKLYNPTEGAIDVSGWKLHKKSQTGTDYSLKEFPAGSMIEAGQSFVWANSVGGFSETADANVSSTETLAANNSIAIIDTTGTIIDAVAWGTGSSQYGEGPPYPTSPGAGQALTRRSSNGMMVNTDNNINDFTLQ